MLIALEEHFALPDTLGNSEQYFTADVWTKMKQRLVDIYEERLAEMDQQSIEMMLLSLNALGIQAMSNASGRDRGGRRRSNPVFS